MDQKGHIVLDLKLRNSSPNRALIFNFDTEALRSWRCSLSQNHLTIDIRLRGRHIFDDDDQFNIAVYHDLLKPAEQKAYRMTIDQNNCKIPQMQNLKVRSFSLEYAYLLLKPTEAAPREVGTNVFFGDETFLEKQATGKFIAEFP